MACCGWPLRNDCRSFRTSEAAFHALKFPGNARSFEKLSGSQAFQLRQQLKGNEDWTYSGFGDNWKAMLHILRAKFQQHSELAEGLLHTEDAFLLEHNSVVGRDDVWSDNGDGSGMNWLGLQLMMVREEIKEAQGISCRGSSWMPFIGSLIDPDSGDVYSLQAQSTWHNVVRSANEALTCELQRNRGWSFFGS
eukprot:UN0065